MAFKAELLRNKYKEQGKTIDDLVEGLKEAKHPKHKRTVSRWLAGENPPKAKDLEALAKVLNCKPQDFDPFFADKSLDEVAIQAHVSPASHNAYELMRWRYGVSQKQIMELAPVLFSIVAGHALNVPKQDDEIARLASERGLSDPRLQGAYLEDTASEHKKCFGIEPSDYHDHSRNLFDEAIKRLSSSISDHVDVKWFVGAAPGVAPNAAGFIPDVELVNDISGGQTNLAEAISKGRIRLSTVLQEAQTIKGSKLSIEEFAEAIRAAQEQGCEDQRKAGLKKLKAWRSFYAERHPDLAAEYDALVEKHCHQEGYYPESFSEDDRTQSWVNPFKEDLYLNKDTLDEYQRRKSTASESGKLELIFPHVDPIYKRYKELCRHRSTLKKQFEEEWV